MGYSYGWCLVGVTQAHIDEATFISENGRLNDTYSFGGTMGLSFQFLALENIFLGGEIVGSMWTEKPYDEMTGSIFISAIASYFF